MTESNVFHLNPDEWLLAKLCMSRGYINQEDLHGILHAHQGKQLLFALLDSHRIDADQIPELMRLREDAKLCPYCDTLNLQKNIEKTRSVCCKCRKSMGLKTSAPLGRPAAQKALSSGDHLGKYKIVEQVAKGSTGIVYKAMHTSLNRPVAIKVLKGEQVNEILLKRFRKEAETIASLDHPNIIRVYDICEEGGIHYIAMEYAEGKVLTHHIEKKRLSPRQSAKIAAEIAAGLYHAHTKGIIHRDIKPDNIILTENDRPKITDFGIARQISSDARMTQPYNAVGTPLYMSPEQTESGERLGPATDIYSLGVVFYEMLTGRIPFNASTTDALFQKIVGERPVTPREINPTVPFPLQEIALKALSKKPEDRFATARDMQKELEKCSSPAPSSPQVQSRTPSRNQVNFSKLTGEPGPANRSQAIPADASVSPNLAEQNKTANLAAEPTTEAPKRTNLAAEPTAEVPKRANLTTESVKKSSFHQLMMDEKAKQDEQLDLLDFVSDPFFMSVCTLLLVGLAYLLKVMLL